MQVPHEDEEPKRRGDEKQQRLVWLDPEARVLLADKTPQSFYTYVEDGDALLYVIEPFRRQFRENNSWIFRWKPDLMTSSYETVGKRDPRCRRCKRNLRGGCSSHVKWQKVERPDPRAGKVFKTASTVKLYGLPVGTTILFQKDGKWMLGTVHEQVTWRETARAEEKAQRKIVNKRRRHARLPSIWERIFTDPLGLDE